MMRLPLLEGRQAQKSWGEEGTVGPREKESSQRENSPQHRGKRNLFLILTQGGKRESFIRERKEDMPRRSRLLREINSREGGFFLPDCTSRRGDR